jgi:hypothetical protein
MASERGRYIGDGVPVLLFELRLVRPAHMIIGVKVPTPAV